MVTVGFLAAIKERKTSQDVDRPKNVKISKHTAIFKLYRNVRQTIRLTISLATTVSNHF